MVAPTAPPLPATMLVTACTVSLPSAPYRVLFAGHWLNSTPGEGLVLQPPPVDVASGHDQQSVMYPAMTHSRASSDSHPGSQNWRGFGGESMFEWALGLWPFKDTFYTNTSAGLNVHVS